MLQQDVDPVIKNDARDDRRGVVLISTLVFVLILGSLIGVGQSRLLSAALALSGLEEAQRQAMAMQAVGARIRPLLAASFTGVATDTALPIDGMPFAIEQTGLKFEVRINDVSGLIDVYFAPDEVLSILPLPREPLVQGRKRALAGLRPGKRFVVLEQSLARFGLDRSQRRAIAGLVTQSGLPAPNNSRLSPSEIRERLDEIYPENTFGTMPTLTTISISLSK